MGAPPGRGGRAPDAGLEREPLDDRQTQNGETRVRASQILLAVEPTRALVTRLGPTWSIPMRTCPDARIEAWYRARLAERREFTDALPVLVGLFEFRTPASREFLQMLREFKGSTQFIVITHNPRTMEAADWIYGVTMEEPGVSSIVAVELEEAAEYVPAGNFGSSASDVVTQVVNKASTGTTLASTAHPSKVGQQVTYTVTVANLGPSPALNVQVTDLVHSDLTVTSVTPDQGFLDRVAAMGAPLETLKAEVIGDGLLELFSRTWTTERAALSKRASLSSR